MVGINLQCAQVHRFSIVESAIGFQDVREHDRGFLHFGLEAKCFTQLGLGSAAISARE